MQLVKAKQVYSFKYESNDQQIKKPFELTAAKWVLVFDLSQGSISSVEKAISLHLLLFRAIFGSRSFSCCWRKTQHFCSVFENSGVCTSLETWHFNYRAMCFTLNWGTKVEGDRGMTSIISKLREMQKINLWQRSGFDKRDTARSYTLFRFLL